MRSEWIFFLLFLVIVIEGNIDLGYFWGIVLVGFIIFDMVINKHKFRLKKLSQHSTSFKAYIALIICEFVMTIIAIPFNYSEFMYDGFKSFIASTVFVLLAVIYFYPHINVKRFLCLIRNFGLVMGCLGVIETISKQYLFSIFNESGAGKTADFRTLLIFVHPAMTAIFMLAIFIILYYIPCKKLIFQYAGYMVLTITIFGTKTRMMWLAYAVIIFLMIMRNAKDHKNIKEYKVEKKKIFLLFFIGLLLILGIVHFYPLIVKVVNEAIQYLNLMFSSNNNYVSRVVRVQNIYNVFRYLLNNPLSLVLGNGLGYGNYFSDQNGVLLYYGDIWNYGIDNQYISLFLETGIWGMGLYLACIFYAFICYFRENTIENRIGSLLVILIAISSVSLDSFAWRICVFILQLGLLLESYKGDQL